MLACSIFAIAILTVRASSKFTALAAHDPHSAPTALFAPVQVTTDALVLEMHVHLAQRDLDGLRDTLSAVSTPGNPRYGQYLSKAEVDAFTRPSAESTCAVHAFFAARGLNASAVSSAGDRLRVRVPAPTVNALFGADYRVFKRADTEERVLRTLKYSLPAELQGHVRLVHPSTSFLSARELPSKSSPSVNVHRRVPVRRTELAALLAALNSTIARDLDAESARAFARLVSSVRPAFSLDRHDGAAVDLASIDLAGLPDWLRKRVQEVLQTAPAPMSLLAPDPVAPGPSTPDAECAETITPSCLQQLYGIPTARATQERNRLLVTGYGWQYAQTADLRAFLEKFRPDIPLDGATFDVQLLDGGMNPQGDSRVGVEANLDMQYAMGIATGVRTTFLSVGVDVSSDQLGSEFLDTALMLLDMDDPPQVVSTSYYRGEGDVRPDLAEALCDAYMQLGARGVSVIFASGDSGVDDASGTCSKTGRFAPTFPASCPYVTSVGSTEGIAPETAAPFSSGGFSDHFSMPEYQASAVTRYLGQHGDKHSGMFNRSGRAFPDVAVQGRNFAVVSAGETISQSGTSASAPVFAGMIALLNDELAAAGRPPLGFLNPWLYSDAAATFAAAFTDVTSGSNPGCGTAGFEALPGWDPVTGLGTPNYPALRKAAGLA